MISKNLKFGIIAISTLIFLFVLDISLGYTNYTPSEILHFLNGFKNNQDYVIITELRIPRAVIAIFAGAGLSVSGLLMQTLFNNPLAGPYVLGINAGSSLLVALSLLTGFTFFSSNLGLITASILGAFFIGLLILFFAMMVRSSVSLLIIGLMIASFCTAVVSILQSYANASELKIFTLWNMGTLQKTALEHLPIICIAFILISISLIFILKPLNALTLGENNAERLGISLRKTRLFIILIVAGFTGLVTAYCGPIAFIGLAVPNLVRIMLRTQNHRELIPMTMIVGAVFLMLCDILIKSLEPVLVIPINAVTSLLGAPFVVFLIYKRRI